MKIKVFKFKASETNLSNKGNICLDENEIERTISEFCVGKKNIDIKVNTIETRSCTNEVYLVYTIMYE